MLFEKRGQMSVACICVNYQAEGSAAYAADEPFDSNGMHMAFVLSTVAKVSCQCLVVQ